MQEALSKFRAENSVKNGGTRRGNPDKSKPYQFKPGQSGNPGGRPKHDLAAEIARAIFEDNAELIYKAMLRALLKGDPRVFTVLAERAYGKAPSAVSVEDCHPRVLLMNGLPIPAEFRAVRSDL